MKPPLFFRFIPLLTATFTAFIANLPVQAVDFQQQEVEQNQFVAIARPYGGNKYDLLILQQIPGKRQCWQEKGNNPIVIDPLLLNFDFTGSCERSTDSNGYSIRLNGQDLGLDYLLRVVERNGELVLVGTSRRNGNSEEIVIGRTHGLGQGLMKIDLDGGWRFTKRAYQGRPLSHVYLTGDRNAINTPQPVPTPQPIANTPIISPSINVSSSGSPDSSGNVVKELTFTAPDSGMGVSPQAPPTVPNSPIPQQPLPPLNRNVIQSSIQSPLQPSLPPVDRNFTQSIKALASLPTVSSGGYRNPNLLPPPPSPKIPRSGNSGLNPSSKVLSPDNSPMNASISGVSYRVMAAVSGMQQQEQVRSLYPDAFATSYQGQRVLQVGVFSTKENATQAYQSLQNAGLRAIIIP
ncbi:MAG: DUF3747 domain-containing protein [Snowella sp.]|nr:DUF3747 domain-containing protein [Snowella sp.]